MTTKRPQNSTLLGAQNFQASRFQIFLEGGGGRGMPPDPLEERALGALLMVTAAYCLISYREGLGTCL